jgi:hypothetical protein
LGKAVNLKRFSDECSSRFTGSSFPKNCPQAQEYDPYTPKLPTFKASVPKEKVHLN